MIELVQKPFLHVLRHSRYGRIRARILPAQKVTHLPPQEFHIVDQWMVNLGKRDAFLLNTISEVQVHEELLLQVLLEHCQADGRDCYVCPINRVEAVDPEHSLLILQHFFLVDVHLKVAVLLYRRV